MADLYDVLFRRPPDLSGFNWWTYQLDSQAMSRDQALNAFFGTPEWQARIAELTAAGCVQ